MADEAERELKPCPLCGLRADLWRAHPENPKRKAWIACTGKCCIMTREYLSDEEAIAAWNTRPADDLAVAVDALREIAGQMRAHEMCHVTRINADFDDGYDACVAKARAALAKIDKALTP